MCRGDWSSHGAHTGGFYSCNKYDGSEAKMTDEEGYQYLSTTPRFLHFFNRYFNHDMLMKEMMQMIALGEVERRMVEYTDECGCLSEMYSEAANLLVECRRVLKFANVYAYFNENSPGNPLFEYQQASAEGITERLSEVFHKSVETIKTNPADFVNSVRVTKKYIKNLVKNMEEGYNANNC